MDVPYLKPAIKVNTHSLQLTFSNGPSEADTKSCVFEIPNKYVRWIIIYEDGAVCTQSLLFKEV